VVCHTERSIGIFREHAAEGDIDVRNRTAGENGVGCTVWSVRICLANYYYDYRIKDISGGWACGTHERREMHAEFW